MIANNRQKHVIFTVIVEECVWGLRRYDINVYLAKRETTRTHKYAGTTTIGEIKKDWACYTGQHIDFQKWGDWGTVDNVTDDTALFELGYESNTITQTLNVDMNNYNNEAWTIVNDRQKDAIFTVTVEETVVSLRQSSNHSSDHDSVYPVHRKTTRSHKYAGTTTIGEIRKDWACFTSQHIDCQRWGKWGTAENVTDDTALFELGYEDTTIKQTLRTEMFRHCQGWTNNYA